MSVKVGEAVPDFTVQATTIGEVTLSSLRGRPVVLYFYPKDNTSGCTREGEAFRDLHEQFTALDAVVFGVSRDSLRSHDRFREKYSFPFELISDSDEKLCHLFDLLHEKTMYGRKVIGLVRSTFLIDREGILRNEWRKVKVDGHAAVVLEALRTVA